MRIIILVVWICVSSLSAEAATIYVSALGDGSCTRTDCDWETAKKRLSQANGLARDGDTILLDYGTHAVSGFLGLKSVTVLNRDQSDDYTLSTITFSTAVSTSRVVVNGRSPTFRGISFTGQKNAYPAVDIWNNTSGATQTVTVSYCRFTDNGLNAGAGGAIRAVNSVDRIILDVDHSLFARNQSRTGGNAIISADNVFASIDASTFRDNFTTSGNTGVGGAVFLRSNGEGTTVTVTDSTFTGNRSGGNGSALMISNADATVTGSSFIDNIADYEALGTNGSAALCGFKNADEGQTQNLTVTNCIFKGNRAQADGRLVGDGGGMMVFGKDPTDIIDLVVSDCDFIGNYANQGAGLYISRHADAVVTRCLFHGNIAYNAGGGSFRGGRYTDSVGDDTLYEYCVFANNKAGYHRDGTPGYGQGLAGGLGIRVFPRADIYHCRFINNVARVSGDSILNGAQPEGASMISDAMRSCMVDVLVWNDPGIGNDVPIRSEDNGWIEISDCAYPCGQELGAGIVPTNTTLLTGTPDD